jgi:hypothetical protein
MHQHILFSLLAVKVIPSGELHELQMLEMEK